MRNLLEEFNESHGIRPPTILGVREHIFTGGYVCKLCSYYYIFSVENANQCLTSDIAEL